MAALYPSLYYTKASPTQKTYIEGEGKKIYLTTRRLHFIPISIYLPEKEKEGVTKQEEEEEEDRESNIQIFSLLSNFNASSIKSEATPPFESKTNFLLPYSRKQIAPSHIIWARETQQ
ncbi:hypothetical protein CEXT_314091 [Caerostris extrusa]|uniref:Uncharacterized protein n=1 Tax=Caerostris extrusa TaxID=172846 RepID=A0AAV4PAF8_CAEEX|nr:hypothetical protein CEXT_314091 [Caerostris extrusa]